MPKQFKLNFKHEADCYQICAPSVELGPKITQTFKINSGYKLLFLGHKNSQDQNPIKGKEDSRIWSRFKLNRRRFWTALRNGSFWDTFSSRRGVGTAVWTPKGSTLKGTDL